MKIRIKANVSRFNREARQLLSERLDQAGENMGSLVVSQTVARIDQGGDDEITYPDLWANRTRLDSYRKGGDPLTDNGNLINSITFTMQSKRNGVRILVGSPLPYARYQHYGFSTSGPNYIPLTLQARRKPKGADPKVFGLKPGVDYIMAWKGVTVPSRPILRFSKGNIQEIRETLAISLERRR